MSTKPVTTLRHFSKGALIVENTHRELTQEQKANVQAEARPSTIFERDKGTGGANQAFDPSTIGTSLKEDTVQIDDLWIAYPMLGYQFRELTIEDVVQGVDGSLQGEVLWEIEPPVNGILHFNQTQTDASLATGKVQVPSDTLLDDLTDSSITFSCFIRWFEGSTGQQVIFDRQGEGYAVYNATLNADTGYVTVSFTTVGSLTATETLTSEVKLPVNDWVHLAVTWDGSKMTIYFNATPRGEKTHGQAASLQLPADDFVIGNKETVDSGFIGYIRDFRIYNAVLPISTIRTISKFPLVLYDVV